jgi:3-deoxy-D-manno-octulosonate 8-phosphate phosphatase (KDO 8-P phosphatase)
VTHRVRAIALDVDGVLTDGSFWWGPNGEEFKRFHFLDIMGIARARRNGIVFAFVSGEASPLVDRLATKLGVEDVHKGCRDKALAVRAFATRHGFDLNDVCFMGDDVNDLPAFAIVGIAAAPSNAHESVIARAAIVTTKPGGSGAVRELIDRLAANGLATISYENPATPA